MTIRQRVKVLHGGEIQLRHPDLQFRDALSLYAERSDKDWGLTDCSSFQIMVRKRLTAAISYDRHFEQAGFQALLR
jgi:hypothetical protein